MEQIENPVPENSNNKSDANAKSNSKQKIEKKSGGNKGIAILTILLLLSIGSTIWLYFDSNKKIDDCTDNYETVSTERNELLSTLDSLEQEYLILRESNDSLNLELEQKIADVQALKKKVQSVRNASRAEINRLEREVALLKEIAIGYNKKIDSLGEINNNLMNSNMQLMADIDEAQKIDMEKTKQLEDLSEKVEKASVLKAINMISIPLNKNSKPNF
jgi:chromosome segregation ATPase